MENYSSSKTPSRKDSTSVQLWVQLIKPSRLLGAASLLRGAAHAAERGHTCASEHKPEAMAAPGSPLSDAGAQTVFRAQDEWTRPSRRTTGSLLEGRNKEGLQKGSWSVGKDGRVCSDLVAPVLKCAWEGREGSARSLQGATPPPVPPAGGSLLVERAVNQPWSKAGARTANQDRGRESTENSAAACCISREES